MSQEKGLDNNTPKSKVSENEEKILSFWKEKDIFKKSLNKPSPKGNFVFYDGPPFATGEPHYGHVVPSTIKDVIPRYKTMQGYHVPRRWGWDCHGLPVENLVEKELKLSSKKDIIDFGIGKFNAVAQGSVMRFADHWRHTIPRLGRWVDMDDDYKTMDSTYTESVWWAFSELYKKGLIYEGFKSMNLCPRCETTLSNFEVSQGYKDITDISVYVEFELIDQPGTHILAWTTTPWTLPGNVALAVNPNIDYVEIEKKDEGTDTIIRFILGRDRLEKVFKESKYEIKKEMKGIDLIGKTYKPVFDYYKNDTKLKNLQNAYKIYGADFVTTEDGTGVVHIAPAFGADDYELSLKYNLPFIQHVATNGKFKKEIIDFAGQDVKPKEDHQKADIEIIKHLAHKSRLFAKEKIVHSYPHCWRCDTPLLNYATSSWFVKVTDIRDKLVAENKKVKWTPPEIGEGRFGNWLLGARDWAISRSRFWGAPLPVWKEETTEEYKVISSVDELRKYSKPNNTYYITRHGEADNNIQMIISSIANNPHHLTERGKIQAREAGKWLSDKKIDIIISSPFLRTKETANIIAENIGFDINKIIYDPKIGELNAGIWNNRSFIEYSKNFEHRNRFTATPEGGENYSDIKKRMGDTIYNLEEKYKGKNILIVTHDTPLFLLKTVAMGLDREQSIKLRGETDHFIDNAKPFKLEFNPLPHNDEYELDLHRPFIDNIKLVSEKGNKLTRIPEVFDCWFESGSMPFGEAHYPFNKCDFNPKPGPFSKILGKTKGYPADFIAEGLDQTRGWFYSMLVLGVALFGKSPFKRVVVNGLVLAEDGQKMSKSKKNYPDIMNIVNKYGADALRYYLLASPVVHAEDFCFIERGVDEVVKKHIGRLNNVVTFYEMYADTNVTDITSTNILDKWILSRLSELRKDITDNLEKYEIDRAIRPFADFIDDLSTWYLRRSRDRFKGDDKQDKSMALSTTKKVLLDLSRLLAPFMPFIAEDVYLRMKGELESVHLETWPIQNKINKELIKDMREIRKIASLGLEARMKSKINVRQPLQKLIIKSKIPQNMIDILKDEVNVKEILSTETQSEEIVLDTNITESLKEEGTVREIIRAIQDLRKEKGLTIKDRAILFIDGDKSIIDLIMKNRASISSSTLLADIKENKLDTAIITISNYNIKLDISR